MKRRQMAKLAACCCVVAAALAAPLWALPGAKKKADPVADLRAAIAKNVPDADRAARMSASVDAMERLTREAGALVAKRQAELAPMLKDYGTTREAVEAKLAEVNEQRVVIARKVLEAHAAFKKDATPDEWTKLAKLEERALASVAASSLGKEPLLGKEK